MTAHECRGPSYQVAVRGQLTPAVLGFCAGPLAHHKTSGLFLLRVHDEHGIADPVAMLQTAGLVILSIRRVAPPDVPVSAGLSA